MCVSVPVAVSIPLPVSVFLSISISNNMGELFFWGWGVLLTRAPARGTSAFRGVRLGQHQGNEAVAGSRSVSVGLVV